MNFESRVKFDSEPNIKRALRTVLIYCVFIAMTTIVAVASRHHYMFYFNHAIKQHFLLSERLVTNDEWWSELANSVVPHVLLPPKVSNESLTDENESTAGANASTSSTEDEVIKLNENILLGTPRLRQLRVEQTNCSGSLTFARHFHYICYPDYSYSDQKTTGEHIGATYESYYTLSTMPINGRIHTYWGGGFVQNLHRNINISASLIESMQELDWLDRGTRLMAFEFILYNENTDLFNNVKVLGEVQVTGGITLYLQVRAVQKHAVWTGSIWIILSAVIFYIMAMYYLVMEILDWLKRGTKKSLKSFWTLIDLVILLLVTLSFSYNIFHPIYLHYYLKHALAAPTEYHSLDVICWLNSHYMNLIAVLAFLVWFKIFQIFNFNKTSIQLNATFAKCYRDLLNFVLIFLIIFFSYAMLGMLLFGHAHEDFFVFPIAFWSVMRMVLADFDYLGVENANSVLAPIYFFSFILIVYFILINMFLAIIFDTFHDIKKVEIPPEGKQLPEFFKKYWDKGKDGGKLALNKIGLFKRTNAGRNTEPTRDMGSENEPPFPPTPRPEQKMRVPKDVILQNYFEAVQNKRDAEQIDNLTQHISNLEKILAKMSDDIKRLEAETSDPSTRPEPPRQPKTPPRLKIFVNRKK